MAEVHNSKMFNNTALTYFKILFFGGGNLKTYTPCFSLPFYRNCGLFIRIWRKN